MVSASRNRNLVPAESSPPNYGDVSIEDVQSKAISGRVWTCVSALNGELKDASVLIRGRVDAIRVLSKNLAFVRVREQGHTVQCVVTVDASSQMLFNYATKISKESIVDVQGIVKVPTNLVKGVSQKQVEVRVKSIPSVSRAEVLPFTLEDAAKSEIEIAKALKAGVQIARVNQDTRLDYRTLDLRTPANQAIFRLKSRISNLFAQILLDLGFVQIDTPKILSGASEGGAAVFKLDYKGKPACLAQSPQFCKQMAISAEFGRVFEVAPVFRAEDSYTHRHLCEFVGLDAEMEIKEHYFEVMDVVDHLFVGMFDALNAKCKGELEAIAKQYPFKPLKYLRKTLRLTFEEGIKMLKDAGVEADPLGDLNTESEKALGKLVLDKYGTDFFMLHRYPLAARPFYTMPCADNGDYSCSFDVFLKRHGAPLHGGFGVGLERVMMLFCALDNIRKTSLFPRDPRRLQP